MPPQDGLKFLFDIQDKISAKLVKIEAKSKSSAKKIETAFNRASKSQEANSLKVAAIEQRRVAAAESNATKLAAIAQKSAAADQAHAAKREAIQRQRVASIDSTTTKIAAIEQRRVASNQANAAKLSAIQQKSIAAAQADATKRAAIAQRGAQAEQRRADKIATALKKETAARDRATAKAAANAGKLSKTFTTFSQTTFAGMVSAAGAMALARKAWTTFTGVISSSLSLWGEQEQSVVAMTTALKAQGTYTPELSKQYQDLAAKLQTLSTDGDETLLKMQALLIQVGDVGPDQMEKALTAAQDLAVGLDVDLKTSALLVGKAFAGDTATLKRYGIVLDQNELKQKGVALVLDKITAKFGGQAAAKAKTFAGLIEQLGNRWGDLKELIGQWLTQSSGLLTPMLAKINKAVGWVTDNFDSLKPILAAVATLAGVTLVAGLAALGVVIYTTVIPAVTLMTGGLNLLIPVIALIAAAGVGAWVAWGDEIKAFLRGTWGKLEQGLEDFMVWVDEAFDVLKGWLDRIPTPILALLGPVGLVMAAFRHWDDIKEIARSVWRGIRLMADRLGAIFDGIKAKVDAVIGFFLRMKDKVVGNSIVPDMVDEVESEFERMTRAMISEVAEATRVTTVKFEDMGTGLHDAAVVMSTEMYEAAKALEEEQLRLAESAEALRIEEEALRIEMEAGTESASGYDLALAGLAGQMGGATGQALNLVIAMREHNKEQRAAAKAGRETEQEFSKIQQSAGILAFAFAAIGDAIGGTAGKVVSELGTIAEAFAKGGVVGGIMAGIASLAKGLKGLFGRGKKKREAAAKAAKEAADVAAKAAEEAAVAAAKIAAAMEDIRLGLLGMPTQAVTEDFRLLRDVWNGMNAAERAQGMDRYVAALQSASAAGIVLTGVEQELLDAFVAYNSAMSEASSRQDAEMAALRTRQEAEMAGIDAQIDAIESRLRPKVSFLQGLLDQQKAELDSLSARQDAEVAALTARRKESLDALKTWQSEQLSMLQETQRKALDALKASQDAEISSIKAARAAALGVFESAIQRELEDERIAAQLKIDIRKAGMDQEAYEAALARAEEATERLLERDELNEAMAEAEARIRERYQHELDSINAHWDKVEEVTTERFQSELTEMEGAHADQLTELEASQAAQLQLYNGFWDSLELGMESRHAVELATMEAAHVAQLEALQSYFTQRRDALAAANSVELMDMQASHDAKLAEIERYWAAARQAELDGRAAADREAAARRAAEAASAAAAAAAASGGGGGAGNGIPGVFQDPEGYQGFQHGGPVRAGRPVLVGEAGPELFIPSQSGRIDPNVSSAGGGVNAKELAKAVSEALQNTRIEVDGRQLGRLTIRHQPIAVAELGGRR